MKSAFFIALIALMLVAAASAQYYGYGSGYGRGYAVGYAPVYGGGYSGYGGYGGRGVYYG